MIKLLQQLLSCLFTASAALLFSGAIAQAPTARLPRIVEKNGRHALLVDGEPYFMLGGQVHNSSAWPGMMPQVWQAVEMAHLNTLEIPVYWEQVEPQEGKFDFTMVDMLLSQARQHNVRLVLLWFATWKNGSSHYMPAWMKQQPAKFPNLTAKDGRNVDSPSPHTKAALDADSKAFAQVMRYLKKADGQHTVIMVQVENEPGAWGSVRDYSPAAQTLFNGPVPAALLTPMVNKELQPLAAKGTWPEVFGANADEYFQAWSVAHYIGQVAAAGKAEYNLPLYVNAALRDPLTNPKANTYESGGATDNVLSIWKAAAPAIDLLAPDIYLNGSEKILKVLQLYDRPDNALFVPETSSGADKVKYLYEVLARGGIGFSPFGIDDNGRGATALQLSERLAPLGKEYTLAGSMMRQLARWSFDGKIKAVVQREEGTEQTIDLGAWQAVVTFPAADKSSPVVANGKLMIAQTDENKFVLIGTGCRITFKPTGVNAGKAWQYLTVDEGNYENGIFKRLRIRNGDETDFGGPRFGDTPVVLQTTLQLR